MRRRRDRKQTGSSDRLEILAVEPLEWREQTGAEQRQVSLRVEAT